MLVGVYVVCMAYHMIHHFVVYMCVCVHLHLLSTQGILFLFAELKRAFRIDYGGKATVITS